MFNFRKIRICFKRLTLISMTFPYYMKYLRDKMGLSFFIISSLFY